MPYCSLQSRYIVMARAEDLLRSTIDGCTGDGSACIGLVYH